RNFILICVRFLYRSTRITLIKIPCSFLNELKIKGHSISHGNSYTHNRADRIGDQRARQYRVGVQETNRKWCRCKCCNSPENQCHSFAKEAESHESQYHANTDSGQNISDKSYSS